MSRFKLLPLTALLAIGLSVAGSAHAGAYSLSSNYVQGFTIGLGGGIVFGPSIDTSSTGAILNAGNSGILGGAGESDAPVAIAPGSFVPGPLPVQFTNPPPSLIHGNGAFPAGPAANLPLGPVIGSNYSYADALITHFPGGTFDARNIAEAHLDTAGSASGTATNSSATGFTSLFTVVGSGRLDFDFMADPLIRVFLNQGVLPGSLAQGTLSAALTITCATDTGCLDAAGGVLRPLGSIMFGWAANGSANGALGVTGFTGGFETLDPENLQASLSVFAAGGQNFSTAFGLQAYKANTNDFQSGTYSLTLAMTETDAVIKKIPEPGTTALMALGLVGLGFATRRKNQA